MPFWLSLFGSTAPAWAQAEQSIVVLVNDDPITVYDIEQRQRFLAVTTQEQPSPALKKKATDMLIEERLQIQQGRKLGITPDEQDVTKVLGGMAQEQQYERRSSLPRRLARWASTSRRSGTASGLRSCGRMSCGEIPPRRVDRPRPRSTRRSGGAGEAEAPKEETTLQLRQVKYEIPTDADQASIAKQLAAVEARPRQGPVLLQSLVAHQGHEGLQDQDACRTSCRARSASRCATLVMNAKIGQMTPPTLSGSAIEAYAVCGKHAIKGDPEKRQQTELKLMEEELGIRAEGLLRDMRQDAFIEYRQQN